MTTPSNLESENWMCTLFSAKSVERGGVVHRSVHDVERCVGRKAFVSEVHRRGFTLVENGEQFVVFCNRDPVRLIVDRHPPRLSERAMPIFKRSSDATIGADTQI